MTRAGPGDLGIVLFLKHETATTGATGHPSRDDLRPLQPTPMAGAAPVRYPDCGYRDCSNCRVDSLNGYQPCLRPRATAAPLPGRQPAALMRDDGQGNSGDVAAGSDNKDTGIS